MNSYRKYVFEKAIDKKCQNTYGRCYSLSHTAYIVICILKDYSGKGVGTAFFKNLDNWAKESDIIRLELTVERHNKTARHLYEKSGFEIEGIRKIKNNGG